MGSLIKKRRKRMRKKKHKKMLKATRWQRRAGPLASGRHRSEAEHRRPDHAHPTLPRVGARDEPGGPAAGQHGRAPPWPSPSRSRQAARRGSTSRAAGSRSLGPSRPAPAQPIPRPVDQPGRHPEGRGEQGVTSGPRRRRRAAARPARPLPAPGPGRRPGRTGRPRPAGPPPSEVGHARPAQHRGGVGRAPAQAGAGGDPLVQPDERPPAGGRQGPPDQVVVAGRDAEPHRPPAAGRTPPARPRGRSPAGRTGRG